MACLAAGLVSACAREEPASSSSLSSSSAASIPEPLLPPVKSAASAPPSWLAELPDAAITVELGATVWAAPPEVGSELVTVAVYRVDALGSGVVSLVDKMGRRIDSVPSALVHAVGSPKQLPEGSLTLFYTWTTPGWLGRVSRAERGEELKVQFDWAGTTRETAVDHAEPGRTGIQPLAYVGFPKAGGKSIGQVLALDATRAFVLTGSGHVEMHARATLDSISFEPRGFTVGRKVHAYRWATGYERGTVTAVIEPGLRFEIKLLGSSPNSEYFITNLSAAQ